MCLRPTFLQGRMFGWGAALSIILFVPEVALADSLPWRCDLMRRGDSGVVRVLRAVTALSVVPRTFSWVA